MKSWKQIDKEREILKDKMSILDHSDEGTVRLHAVISKLDWVLDGDEPEDVDLRKEYDDLKRRFDFIVARSERLERENTLMKVQLEKVKTVEDMYKLAEKVASLIAKENKIETERRLGGND